MAYKSQYRRIPRYLWNDPPFKHLDTDAKFVFLHLWTSPHSNVTGITVITTAALALTLGWTAQRVDSALTALCDAGLADVDVDAELVAVHVMEYDPPDSSKVVRHWIPCLVDAPASPVIVKALERLRQHCIRRQMGYVTAFNEIVDELPDRLTDGVAKIDAYTVSDRVSHTVSDTVPDTRKKEEGRRNKEYHPPLPPRSPVSEVETHARARASATDEPERIDAIFARMGGVA